MNSMTSDRHIVVTGAGSGIGRAIALRLAAKGTRLSLLARTLEPLEATVALVRRRGSEASAFACDIRVQKEVDVAFDAAATLRGPIHALIANSGIGGANAPGEADRFDDLIATNLRGTYACLRAAERNLAPGPDARHLVVISSILARIGVAGYTGYCASKAGLLGLVRALAVELAPANVQVNALCPGWVDTGMARAGLESIASSMNVSLDEAQRIAMQPVPLGRMSAPEDVAALVGWLLSGEARGITGSSLDINNGAFMH